MNFRFRDDDAQDFNTEKGRAAIVASLTSNLDDVYNDEIQIFDDINEALIKARWLNDDFNDANLADGRAASEAKGVLGQLTAIRDAAVYLWAKKNLKLLRILLR